MYQNLGDDVSNTWDMIFRSNLSMTIVSAGVLIECTRELVYEVRYFVSSSSPLHPKITSLKCYLGERLYISLRICLRGRFDQRGDFPEDLPPVAA